MYLTTIIINHWVTITLLLQLYNVLLQLTTIVATIELQLGLVTCNYVQFTVTTIVSTCSNLQ